MLWAGFDAEPAADAADPVDDGGVICADRNGAQPARFDAAAAAQTAAGAREQTVRISGQYFSAAAGKRLPLRALFQFTAAEAADYSFFSRFFHKKSQPLRVDCILFRMLTFIIIFRTQLSNQMQSTCD